MVKVRWASISVSVEYLTVIQYDCIGRMDDERE